MQYPSQEPIVETQTGDTKITILGTAHVSKASADMVTELLVHGGYQAVAVELCPSRYNSLVNPDSLAKLDLFKVIRNGQATLVIASLALGAYQQRLADQFGIKPGAEQHNAIQYANEHDLSLYLIDREISTTLKRVAANLSWWKRWTLFVGIFAGILSKDEVSEDEIEKLKEGDILETTFAEFAEDRQDLYQPLIDERDRFMAARIKQEIATSKPHRLLVVIGAGHQAGIVKYLQAGEEQPETTINQLNQVPKTKTWLKLVPWLIVLLVLSGFALGFSRSQELGWSLVADWVIINGGLSALGALIAAAHPVTVMTAFLAAPLTSLNPTIGAGMVTGMVELLMRKPMVEDFSHLRQDTSSLKGWWRNRVSRVLLVFILSTLGSAVGTYLAGFRIFTQLSS